MNADFCQGEIEDPRNDRILSYHPLLNTYSNQEHDNAIHHLSFPRSIEELVEKINRSVPM